MPSRAICAPSRRTETGIWQGNSPALSHTGRGQRRLRALAILGGCRETPRTSRDSNRRLRAAFPEGTKKGPALGVLRAQRAFKTAQPSRRGVENRRAAHYRLEPRRTPWRCFRVSFEHWVLAQREDVVKKKPRQRGRAEFCGGRYITVPQGRSISSVATRDLLHKKPSGATAGTVDVAGILW